MMEKSWHLFLVNILPWRWALSLIQISEIVHETVEDLVLLSHRDDGGVFPDGFDTKVYAILTFAVYLLVGMKCINLGFIFRREGKQLNAHLWVRLGLTLAADFVKLPKSAFFKVQRFGDSAEFKAMVNICVFSDHFGTLVAFQAIELLAFNDLCANPSQIFFRPWRWCRILLRKVTAFFFSVSTIMWLVVVWKFGSGGNADVSEFLGFTDNLILILITMTVALVAVGIMNVLGIVLRSEKMLMFGYFLGFAAVTCSNVGVLSTYKLVKTNFTRKLLVGAAVDNIKTHLFFMLLNMQWASMLRWVSYMKLHKTMPIGEVNEQRCLERKQDFSKEAGHILDDLYVFMPWMLRKGDMLGEGHFSKVYKTEKRSICYRKPIEFAAKEVQKEEMDIDDFLSALVSEIKTLQALGNHHNLVGFIGVYDIRKTGGIGILLEYCGNGCLLQRLQNMGAEEKYKTGTNSLKQFYHWAEDIAKGMGYLHSRKVVHGDLSARNILLDGNLTCKLSDFGMSLKLYTYETYRRTRQKPLPFRWMSPEVLMDLKFSTASDVWAYGVTLWEIFSFGEVPWKDCSFDANFVRNIREEGHRLVKPTACPQQLYDSTLLKCWELRAEERVDAGTMLKELGYFTHGPNC